MFISVLELFKIGIGPSSSHTMGPMRAACEFVRKHHDIADACGALTLRCTLKGSLSATGRGHATDRALVLGLNGYLPEALATRNVDALLHEAMQREHVTIGGIGPVGFRAERDIVFDDGPPLPEHPNGMIFELIDSQGKVCVSETCYSIGGGFIARAEELDALVAPLRMNHEPDIPYPFDSAREMLDMAAQGGLDIAGMKRANETARIDTAELEQGLDRIWEAMRRCLESGLEAEGVLPERLRIPRRARKLHLKLSRQPEAAEVNDWLCAYAMAVNEENADGHMVVTAPTNGAAGVIPAVLYHFVMQRGGTREQVHDFLLTAAAIGGLIKHRSSISGAEVGCQGEVGSAAAMAAAGLCAVRGGSPEQVEQAAEIALEHHLGMTCDPVAGLVQVPCIERNGFGAIKAHAAASLALHGDGTHFMPLDKCIAAMKQTGEEMSVKLKETSLGGLAVTITEC